MQSRAKDSVLPSGKRSYLSIFFVRFRATACKFSFGCGTADFSRAPSTLLIDGNGRADCDFLWMGNRKRSALLDTPAAALNVNDARRPALGGGITGQRRNDFTEHYPFGRARLVQHARTAWNRLGVDG